MLLLAMSPVWAAAPEAPAPAPAAGGGVKVTVERLGNFYYAGEPVLVRVAIFNTGTTPHENSGGTDLLGDLVVAEDSSGALKHKKSPSSEKSYQPASIAPGGFFGFVADLRDVVEGLDKPGRYHARYSAKGLESDNVPIVLISPYDPAKAYQATMETDYGKVVFDLLAKEAPKHVHNFHDLAQQGYYDGTLFHVVVKGIELRGGDKTGDGMSTPGYELPLELNNDLKHHRGTLSGVRGPSSDHGAQFSVGLGDNPAVDGQLTIFGLMASGEEALTAMENLPTSGQRSYPFFKPLKEVRIRTLRVAPAPEGAKATPESAAAAKAPSKP
jgi:peptidyl-prolyl cis-trans isomerase B (cyclophilin B)